MGFVAVIRAGANEGCVAVLLCGGHADFVPLFSAAKRIDFVADQMAAFQQVAPGTLVRDETVARRLFARRIISGNRHRQGDPAASDAGQRK